MTVIAGCRVTDQVFFRILSAGLILLCSGCSVVGPTSIGTGRLAYNDVITMTNDQQMLMAVLKNRYEEHASLLAVSSVTANVRVAGNLGLQAGMGNSSDYAGNLVPFLAGATYEENPTISYTPVDGVQYLQQLMSPVPLGVVAQMGTSLVDPGPYLTALISSVNGIYNPEFLQSGEEPDPRFARFITLMSDLIKTRRLHWASASQTAGEFSIILDRAESAQAKKIEELLAVLSLNNPQHDSDYVIIPVSLALNGRDAGAMGITTRSVFELIDVLTASVDVPEEDLAAGVALRYPSPGAVGRNLQISRSTERPSNASVAVEYRNYWFYIDDRSMETKRMFKMVGALWTSSMNEGANGHARAPLLTVPVSR